MKINKLYTMVLSFLVVCTMTLNGQTLNDALRLTDTEYAGTARSIGSGGPVFGGLGGDQGGILYNPAVLGNYVRGEMVFSPMINYHTNITKLNGNSIKGLGDDNLVFGNFGFVISQRGRGSKWKSRNVSIGYYKVADFNEQLYYSGLTEGSIVQRFQERANGKNTSQLDLFEAGPAYQVGAIFDFDNDAIYETDLFDGQEILKEQSISRSGGINEIAINWGGNYKDKLLLGIGVGIPIYRFNEVKSYTESAPDNRSPFRSLLFEESLKTRGSGINLKLGVIAMPVKFLRIGAGIHTGTSFTLSDDYSTSIKYSYMEENEVKSYSEESPQGSFDYGFNSPFKIYGNAALLYNNDKFKGFVGGFVKYSNYAGGRFDLVSESNNSADVELQNDLNAGIDNQLSKVLNYGIGAELAYDIFRLRSGIQFYASPFEIDARSKHPIYNVGIGFRFDNSYVDLGLQYQENSYGYSPYQLVDASMQPVVNVKSENTKVALTVGYMFRG